METKLVKTSSGDVEVRGINIGDRIYAQNVKSAIREAYPSDPFKWGAEDAKLSFMLDERCILKHPYALGTTPLWEFIQDTDKMTIKDYQLIEDAIKELTPSVTEGEPKK
jgi:hypothetical protein